MAEEIDAKIEVEVDPINNNKIKTETENVIETEAKVDDTVDEKVKFSSADKYSGDINQQKEDLPKVERCSSKKDAAKIASEREAELEIVRQRKAAAKAKRKEEDDEEKEKAKSSEKKTKSKKGSDKKKDSKHKEESKKSKKKKKSKVDPDWNYEGKSIGEIMEDLEAGIVPKAESKVIKRWLKEVRKGQEKIDEDFLKKTIEEADVEEPKKRKGFFGRIKQFFSWLWKKIKSIFKRDTESEVIRKEKKKNKKNSSNNNKKASNETVEADSKPKTKKKHKQGQGEEGDATIRDMVYDKSKKKAA